MKIRVVRTISLREYLGDFYRHDPRNIWQMMDAIERDKTADSWILNLGASIMRDYVRVVYDK